MRPLLLTLAATAATGGCYIADQGPDDPHDPWFGTPCRDAGPPPGPPPGDPPPPSRRPDASPTPPPPASCTAAPVERFKELLIIDRSVVQDSRARNDVADAPWSFRRRLEDLTAGDRDPAAAAAHAWLAQWKSTTRVVVAPGAPGGPQVEVAPRPGVETVLLCPWLRLTPSNGCAPGCYTCAERRVDLGQAPFRLLAIVNRMDLGAADGACGRDGGELRFVYTAVRPDTGAALPMTVGFEYQVRLAPGQDRRSWASAWHALGRLPFGPSYNGELATLVARALDQASLRRVVTNELALGEPHGLPWELRQFVPGGTSAAILEPTATDHTPRLALNHSEELARWIDANPRAIAAGDNLLPTTMIAGAAPMPTADFAWRAPGAEPAAVAAFNRNTCNGCHAGRLPPADLPFQHIAAAEGAYYPAGGTAGPGPARLSRHLHAPGSKDELTRRAALLEAALCTPCTGGSPYPL
jgi:hypothetical protein